MRGAGVGGWAASSGATSRWTATAAGSARSAPTTCWSRVGPSTAPPTGEQAVRDAYARGETDEFVEPTLVGEEAAIRPDRDAVLAFNFRPDRMRQLSRALAEPDFDEIDRGGAGPLHRYATMTVYEEGWPYPVAFAPARPAVTLAGVLAARRDLPVARRRDREVRARDVLLQRRRGAAVRRRGARADPLAARRPDLRPQAGDERAARSPPPSPAAGASAGPDFGIVNFANPDMVGHTGVIPAAVRAIEVVDAGLGRGGRGRPRDRRRAAW